MPRTFHRWTNTVARAGLLALPVLGALVGWAAWGVDRSPYVSRQGVVVQQPVPFSHKHHVGGLGIDCRYCHTSVTESSFAGLPPTKTCMTCHSRVWTNAAVLAPVRESWRTGKPIAWRRVNQIPGYAYFDHSIHVAKGVGCVTCHGQVDEMPLTWQAKSLQMGWCLECHRRPEENLRPREEVFNVHYEKPANQAALGRELMERYQVRSAQALTDCATCHR